jgi:hypothetical protein
VRRPICLAEIFESALRLAKNRLVWGGEKLYWSGLRHQESTTLLACYPESFLIAGLSLIVGSSCPF